MLDLRIHPECDLPELMAAAAGYQRLWDAHRERIVTQFKMVAGLDFAEGLINAIVWDGGGFATPLRFRNHPDEEFRLGTIIHELSHRLIRGNRARLGMPPSRPELVRENHELIDLFLFDVWCDLFGEDFARRRVAVESAANEYSRDAWQATLTLDRTGRAAKLKTLLGPQPR
jgi:hypothetical protein